MAVVGATAPCAGESWWSGHGDRPFLREASRAPHLAPANQAKCRSAALQIRVPLPPGPAYDIFRSREPFQRRSFGMRRSTIPATRRCELPRRYSPLWVLGAPALGFGLSEGLD